MFKKIFFLEQVNVVVVNRVVVWLYFNQFIL